MNLENYIFDDFIKMMEKMAQEDDIDGRMRVLSKDPRYATDSPNAPELSDVEFIQREPVVVGNP